MATIKPFKAVRPTRDKVGLFATRTYLSYDKKGLREKLLNNPYTFLQIINPDFENNKKINKIEKFNLINKEYERFIKEKILKKEEQDAFYIYELNHEGRKYKGIIGATSTEEYYNGIIKRHEKTIEKRESLFTKYLSIINFNADPVLLSYKSNEVIDNLIDQLTSSRSEYEFTTSDKATHKLWVIKNSEKISKISNEFKKIDSFYIADGHHRTASSYRLSKEKGPKLFMSFLINENHINIYSFNRVLIKTPDFHNKELIIKLKEKFEIKNLDKLSFQSKKENEILLYYKKKSYSLTPKKGSYSKDILSALSYSILSNNIIKPIFNLDDNSEKIKYFNGKKNIEHIIKIIDETKNSVAFILKPIKIKKIREIADKNLTLPPKSTYIDPKLRSGITILDLK